MPSEASLKMAQDFVREYNAANPGPWFADSHVPALAALLDQRAEVERERIVKLVAEEFDSNIRAYPEDIFTPPKPGQHGRTVDGCSAAALRAVLPILRDEIVRSARAEAGGGKHD